AGTPFTVTINRNGQIFIFQSRTAPYPPGENPYQSFSRRGLILNGFLFLITGVTVLLLKPDSRQAWLLAMMLGTFIGTMTDFYPYSFLGRLVETIVSLAKISALWFFPIFLLFFLNFPERSPILHRWPRLESWIYWSLYVLVLPYWLANRLPSFLRSQYVTMPGMNWWLNLGGKYNLPVVFLTGYLALGFLFMIISYRSANVDSRKRMRVAMIGSSAGFLALFILVLDNLDLFKRIPGWPVVVRWVQTIIFYTLPLIPLSFTYAIIRHKVIPISLIIRRGVRYLLVSRGSFVIEIIIVSLVFWMAMDRFFIWFRPSSGRVVSTISAIVAVLVWQSFRWFHLRYLAPIIDRSFFRESYDAQQILTELAESVRTTTNVRELLELIAERIQKALHSENVSIFLREPNSSTLKCEVSADYLPLNKQSVIKPCEVNLTSGSPMIKRLAEMAQPISLNGDEGVMNGADARLWRELKTELLLPMTSKDELIGVISLGQRAGDLPYSSDDERMLMNVAVQTALAIENTRLIEQTIEQERKRKELEAENEQRAKELEEARKLQLSMLPKKLPVLPQFEIAAYMKTASEVGGDYYDFHLDSESVLTIAVGDATGHGLKAGTLVSSVKSLFVSLADHPNIPYILQKMSRVLKEMRLRGLFMAMTMAKLKGNQLTISLAGMPPVLIYRAATGEIEEVQLRALPLGSLANYRYQQLEYTLSSGDVVVMMSDGLPERFNQQNEMFDEGRIREVLRVSAKASPQEVIAALVKAGDDWANGRPQDDDMTFVIIKVR
ncbi:MAG TPA: GAF domain-containing SpoIIE family protein phosphatase, partial [Blastocatellia bacterium]|nr:GAF domain-containing SpoIIE family protein phosphatase [Blastocatellia bacterium]